MRRGEKKGVLCYGSKNSDCCYIERAPRNKSVLPFTVLLFHFQEIREDHEGIQNICSDGLEGELKSRMEKQWHFSGRRKLTEDQREWVCRNP